MKQPGGWMQLPTDNQILEALTTGLDLKPSTIAHNIGKARTTVQERLPVLVEYGLIEKVDDAGYYRITAEGEAYLEGDLDADGLEPDTE
ncbi:MULTISPECIES: winged helix-turn-helix domain-containing protein [unclassified Natrinema]|uniref:Transcriptional regulator n=1 Tax=Saline Natrinema sp. J7-1 virus 2 TaxID=2847286 RepID=A0A976SEP5_9VIRU|nr:MULTISPECIES: winged helix-turn-helix domain-containing protein [unclassified Natrinema]YP_010772527.1 transcriptional regulator [Saline Natrinema sp. J7-1 virus 2]UUT36775.1 transcriptional regulator [Saline Natrinema sp. J7-1 virus 2]